MAAVKVREQPALALSVRAEPGAAGPALEHRARSALLALVVAVVVAQPIGLQVANQSLQEVYGGVDVHSQWTQYIGHPAPDVLFIGPSNARMDVDAPLLERILSAWAGRHISVGKLGINAEQTRFLEALTYRVMNLPSRPRIVVFIVAAGMFNPTFFCPGCVSSDLLTLDLWQISYPLDAGFMRLASDLDPRWPWLLTGWALPAVGYWPQEVAAVQCPVVNAGRQVSIRLHELPPPALLQPTPCDLGVHPLPNEVMTPEKRAAVNALYLNEFVGNYRFSPDLADGLRQMVSLSRRAGARPLLVTLPEFALSQVAPTAHAQFWTGIRTLDAELRVAHVDLTGELNDRPELWTDPMHLNRNGAAVFAPTLAQAIWSQDAP